MFQMINKDFFSVVNFNSKKNYSTYFDDIFIMNL